MIVRIIRIILAGVVFRNDGIRCQIQEETGDDLIQMILGNDLSDHDKCSDPEAGAPVSDFPGFRKFCLRKVFQEVSVWIHRLSRNIQALADRRILRNGIMLIRTVLAIVSIVNIGYSTDRFPRDSMPGIRNFDLVIEIHGALLTRVN